MTSPSVFKASVPLFCAAAFAVAGALAPMPGMARAAEPVVAVAADQTVTAVGTFDSLEALLTELCERAGVELRAWDAPDRAVVVDERGRSFSEAIERLLAAENFLLGVRGGEGDEPVRVAWIRVTGRAADADAVLARGLRVPSDFGAEPFEEEDPSSSRRAMAAVARTLLADEDGMAQILRAEPADLARSLSHYPHIDELLRNIRAGQPHPAVIAKIDAVLRELEAGRGDGSGNPDSAR